MKLQMHSIHFDADQKLVNFIQKKTDKLETFYDRIIDGEVFMRLDKGVIETIRIETEWGALNTEF